MQVNDEVADKLYEEILKEIENENVINAYSGAGLLSGIIAKESKRVLGVEINKSASIDFSFESEMKPILEVFY